MVVIVCPCPFIFLHALPLCTLCKWLGGYFFIPARLVWKPCCWKNSQWNMWWGWFSLALIITENDGKIWAISRKGKGALSLLRASGEGMWCCLVLPVWNTIWKRLGAVLSLPPHWMSLPEANLWIMKLLGRGRHASLFLPRSLVVRGATLKVQWSRMAVCGVRAGSSLSVGTLCGGRGRGRLGNQQVWILLRTVTHQPSDLM